MRPDIPIEDDQYASVREYAKENGLALPRAWVEIIQAGIDAVNDTTDTDHDSGTQH